jgi:carbon-monoxide dehydrogenase large subunit
MASPTVERVFGQSLRRREDPRLVSGHGRYVDDVRLPGLLHLAFLRSPHANARVRRLAVDAAREQPGVVGVITGQDLVGMVNPVPCGWSLPDMKVPEHPALALDAVRYVGDAVAAVVATDPYLARDAVDAIEVEYEALPAVVDQELALQPGAPLVHEALGTNLAFHWAIGGDVEPALRQADRVVKLRLRNQRLIPNSIETRGVIAQPDAGTGDLTIWTSTQIPHLVRLLLSLTLGVPEHKLRVIAPDVGGGFGSKLYLYAEEMVVAAAARLLGAPVKWIEERGEAYRATIHGRDHIQDAELGVMQDGRIVGLRVHSYANVGAYLSTFAPGIPTVLFGVMVSGNYRIPEVAVTVDGVFTNTTPVDAYRGAGRPEATLLVERLVDCAAAELAMDPVELRRRNLIPPDAFPYEVATGVTYDSGNYEQTLNRALELVDYAGLRAEQARLRTEGKYLGIGIANYVEISGLAPSHVLGAVGGGAGGWESATIRVAPTGKVTLLVGTSPQGQGHDTTFAQVVADGLGLPVEDVEVVHGDTAIVPAGIGTFGSRSAATGGVAAALSVEKVRAKAKQIAAHLLEASEADIEFEAGKFFPRGSPERAKSFQDIALQAFLAHNYPKDLEPGLDATTVYDPSNFTWPFGTHVAVVEIDADSGAPRLRRYLAVDDCGNVINPMIVDGQVHGGVVQGIGQALYEQAVYGEDGQLLTANLMKYAVPKASQVPSIETARTVTPSPVNLLGVKGTGEAGTIAATAAVVNAAVDALSGLGVRHLEMPMQPGRVWEAIQQAKAGN